MLFRQNIFEEDPFNSLQVGDIIEFSHESHAINKHTFGPRCHLGKTFSKKFLKQLIDEIFHFSTLIKVYPNKIITIVYKLHLRDCAQNWKNTCAASGFASKKKSCAASAIASQIVAAQACAAIIAPQVLISDYMLHNCCVIFWSGLSLVALEGSPFQNMLLHTILKSMGCSSYVPIVTVAPKLIDDETFLNGR